MYSYSDVTKEKIKKLAKKMEIAVPGIGAFHFESQQPQSNTEISANYIRTSSMQNTHANMHQRGETLSTLEIKSLQLTQDANDFMSMARKMQNMAIKNSNKSTVLSKLPSLTALGKTYLDEIVTSQEFSELLKLLDSFWKEISEKFPQITQEAKGKLNSMSNGQMNEILSILLGVKDRITVTQFVTEVTKAVESFQDSIF